jgi:hypothetical protein
MRRNLVTAIAIICAALAGFGSAHAKTLIQPQAISSKIVRLDLYDDDGVGDINVDVHYVLSTNSAEAIALGSASRGVVVKMEGTRATVISGISTIIGASLVTHDGGWPEGALPLPRPRKP